MIYRCPDGHISFARELKYCGMKDCGGDIQVISNAEIDWFYRISESGLAIREEDLHMIIEDKNMPDETKSRLIQVFPVLKKRRRFWSR